jgi:protein involved in plasmid replication-relaxation
MCPKTASRNVSLQDRDVSLIRMLAEEFLVLTREQIGELFPMGSIARLNFRLKQLREAGYLSVRDIARFGAMHTLGYYLGPQSLDLFHDPAERRVAEAVRAKAAELAPSGMSHRMRVDTVHIRFLTAGRDSPDYKLLTWIDQYSPWWATLHRYGVPIQADGYCEYLKLMHFNGLFTFFLEVDLGTERGRAIEEKVDRYIAYAKSHDYERKFAAHPFRVLFIASSLRRSETLLKMIEARTAGIFWITSFEEFRRAKLFDAYWRRPHQGGLQSLSSHT